MQNKQIVKLRFAFMPHRCSVCDKFLWFRLLYIMPWYYRAAYEYGPYESEVHCVSCHKEMIRDKGLCTRCKWGYFDKEYTDYLDRAMEKARIEGLKKLRERKEAKVHIH